MTVDIYKEPTYKLKVTSYSAHREPVKPNANLDRLVDEVMQKRYGTELRHFTPKKEQKLRQEVANSLMEKPTFESDLHILLPLAKAQGLTTAVQERLKKITDKDLTPVIEFLFSDYKEENFGFLLGAKLVTLLGAKNEALRDEVFVEVCLIRRELKKVAHSTSAVDPRKPVVIENLDPNEPSAALFNHYKTLTLDANLTKLLDACFAKLALSSLSEKIVIRAFIAEILDIPYQVQITGSKDAATRTAIVAAVKKGIHTWLKIEAWKNNGSLKLPEPDVFLNQFFTSNIFREYTEAALFESLPATTSFSGVLDGKVYTPSRGFSFNTSPFDTPLPILPLTGRHIKSSTLIKRLIDTTILTITMLVLTTLYIAFFPLVLGALYFLQRENFSKEAKRIFVSLLLMPIHLGMSKHWIDLNTEKQLVRPEDKPQTAPELQAIFDQMDALSSRDYTTLLHFVKTGEGTADEELLRALAHHWNHLSDAPSRVRKIVKAAPNSPILLFQLLTKFSRESITQAIEDHPPLWPAENSADDLVRLPPQEGILPLFEQDHARTHYVVHGKYRNYDLPLDNNMDNLQEALHDISALRGSGIPYAVQASLTQKMTLTHILVPIYASLNSDLVPPNPTERKIIVEEGDESFFWLTVKKSTVFRNTLGKPSVNFHFSYRLKISRLPNGAWFTEFASITPVRFEIPDEGMGPLLETVTPANMQVSLQEKRLETLVNYQTWDCEALARWKPESLVTIQELEKQALRHVEQLDPAATRKMIRTIKDNIKNALTPEGKAALLRLKALYEENHYTKEMKYGYALDSLKKIARPKTGKKSLEIYNFIRAPYTDARKHYQTFVEMLREALQQEPNNEWLKQVALHRFAGIRLDQYCQGLVEMHTGEFDEPLTWDNFREEVDRRNQLAHALPSKHSIFFVTRILQTLSGVFGIKFDPSRKFNVPYVYGDLTLKGRKITILRHGTPIAHHNPKGVAQRLVGVEEEIPETTADYRAFKEQAQGHILHIILENGHTQHFNSESARVRTRLAQQGDHFTAIALRMDGNFIEPKSYVPQTVEDTKAAIKAQCLGDFNTTHFSIPDSIRNKAELIDQAMNLVQQYYFSKVGKEELTKEQYQAFILLTYADLTLKLCSQLDISYLEAGCKDDIDRGGAFKAILKLHALHLEENDNPHMSQETISLRLQEIMVNLIAAPIIVSKRGVVDHRVAYVRNVVSQIPVIQD